jgi:diguanylate cyclase (GGDEF)-like protein
VAVAVAGLATAGVLWLTGDRTSRPLLSLLLSIGILMTTTVQLASGSARAAAAYGVFHVLTVAYVVLSAGAVEIVGQVTLVVITQIFVARQMGTFGPGDTRGLAALIFVNVASGVGVGLVLFQHVHGRRKAEHYASAQSGLDALTGLANRPALLQQVDRFLRANVVPPALLLVDLAGFRDINDTFGVEVGDQLLRAVAERLTSTIRAEDVLARIGGDEFAVLLEPRFGAFDGAVEVSKQIAKRVGVPMQIKGHSCSIGVSIGIAVFPDHGREPNALLRKADAAMYEAKKKQQVIAGASDASATTVLERLQTGD